MSSLNKTTEIKMLTKLEIFEKVSNHLLTQNERSTTVLDGDGPLPSCAYRGDNGAMCAAGVLIKDEFYHPYIENETVASGRVVTALIKSGVNMNNIVIAKLLQSLQTIHDDHEPREWAKCLNHLKTLI